MKHVKLGIAGLGRMGFYHAENIAYHTPRTELVALCDLFEQNLTAAGQKLGVDNLYSDFDHMLADKDIDGVVIVTSSDLHAQQIIKALRAGKHVFCEKPLGVTVEECLEVEREVAAHPAQIFMVGFMRRFDPSYVYAKAQADGGKVGDPYLYKGYGADPMASIDGMITFSGKGSGGLFVDLGVHDIDLMRWFLGEDPTGVFAIGGSYKYPAFAQQGDAEAGLATFTFASGKMATLHAARAAAHGYHVESEIVGTEGSLRVSPVPRRNYTDLYIEGGVVTECQENFPQRFREAYRAEFEVFASCIREGRQPEVTVTDGRKAVQIALAAKQSFEEKRYMEIAYE